MHGYVRQDEAETTVLFKLVMHRSERRSLLAMGSALPPDRGVRRLVSSAAALWRDVNTRPPTSLTPELTPEMLALAGGITAISTA